MKYYEALFLPKRLHTNDLFFVFFFTFSTEVGTKRTSSSLQAKPLPTSPHLQIRERTGTPAWLHSSRGSPRPSSGPPLQPARRALGEEAREEADDSRSALSPAPVLPAQPLPPLPQASGPAGPSVVHMIKGTLVEGFLLRAS